MTDNIPILKKRGKWSESGVPHKGWKCIDIEDAEEPIQICEMCESQAIRYIHHMQHKKYPDVLSVGSVCAGNMEQNLARALGREELMKSRVQKRKRWLARKWKVSKKGNDFIKTDGFVITVFKKGKLWNGHVIQEHGPYEAYSRKSFPTSDRVKLAAFDLVTRLIFEQESN